MANFSYNKLWESDFDNMVSKKDKVHYINFNQLKLEVHDTYKKDEKLKTNFKPVYNDDFENKTYLEENLKNRRSYFRC